MMPDYSNGSFVGYLPHNPRAVATKGGLAPEQIHMTGRYLGSADTLDIPSFANASRVINEECMNIPTVKVSEWRIKWLGDVEVRDAGLIAAVLNCDPEPLQAMHDVVCDILDDHDLPNASEFKVWVPHITLEYIGIAEAEKKWPEGHKVIQPIIIDRVVCALGDSWTYAHLNRKDLTAQLDDDSIE